MTNQTCNTEKLREIFARGLVSGLGDKNQTCIEGAIALACGGNLSDSPPCVATADRAYSIRINDARWSSPHARADALLPLALAQIGTAGTDRTKWVRALTEGTIRRVLPPILRKIGLTSEADRCESEGTAVASYAAAAAAAEVSYAAAARAYAVSYAAEAAAAAAEAAYAAVASYGAAAEVSYASSAAAYAAAAAAAAAADDEILLISVQVALDSYRITVALDSYRNTKEP